MVDGLGAKGDRLGEVGEKEAIARVIAKYISKPNKWERLGVLDDARDLIPRSPRITFSIDGFSLNSVKLPWRSLSDIGWCSIVATVSDHVVKGSAPREVMVSLGLPRDWSLNMLDEFYKGVYEAVSEYGLRLLGGDLNVSSDPWVSVSIIGYSPIKKPPSRCCGKVGDVVIATGIYGAMGFVNKHGFIEASRHEWVINATKRPKPHLDLSIVISSNYRYINASMDVSDGLGYTILELSKTMGKGVELINYPHYHTELDAICLSDICLWEYVLNGGEEYGSVLIVDPLHIGRITSMLDKFHVPYRIIGSVINEEPGIYFKGGKLSAEINTYDQFIGWKPL